jgi:hypothetical protein
MPLHDDDKLAVLRHHRIGSQQPQGRGEDGLCGEILGFAQESGSAHVDGAKGLDF